MCVRVLRVLTAFQQDPKVTVVRGCGLFDHLHPEQSNVQVGSVFFLEQHHVRVGNLAGGRRRAEASRRHFAHILVFFSCVGARVGT